MNFLTSIVHFIGAHPANSMFIAIAMLLVAMLIAPAEVNAIRVKMRIIIALCLLVLGVTIFTIVYYSRGGG